MVRTNATLQVGALTDSVTVEAKAQVLDTDRATVSETIDERAVVELPLNGRNVWNLAATTPGVLGGLNSDIGLSFRGAGQREIQNSLSLDGINSSANLLAATSMRPIADAVTEIQVQTGSTSAEYGAYLGVHINVVTKSGTNDLHGSVFHFVQDESLDSRGYFDNPALPKNPRNSKQFGAELDGPLTDPRGSTTAATGRSSWSRTKACAARRSRARSRSVPTALMRQGNFSEVTHADPEPRHRAAVPGQHHPGSRCCRRCRASSSSTTRTPNRAGTANNFQGPSANSDNVDQFLVRLDQNIGNKVAPEPPLQLARQLQRPTRSTRAIPITAVTQPRVNKNWLFGYTHTLRPNLHNDFRIGYHHIDFDTLNQFAVNGQADAGTSLGIPGFDGDTKFSNPGIPSVNVSNFTGIGAGGTNWFQFDTTFQVSNVLAVHARIAHHPRRASTCGG